MAKLLTAVEPLIDTLILTEQFSDYRIPPKDQLDLRLGPLGKLNIFVGANNSGKSRLMRIIASGEPSKLFWTPRLSDPDHRAADMRNHWVNGCREIVRSINAHGSSAFPEVKSEAERFLALVHQREPSLKELSKGTAFLASVSALPRRFKPTEGWRQQLVTH